MKIFTAIFITFLIVGVTLLVLFNSVLVKDEITIDKQTIYIESEFGCVPVDGEFTDAQWEAKQDLMESIGIDRKVRC